MTCDEVFDQLTLAVAPVDGQALGEHLAGCARCRSLAETIEPALELFRAAAAESHAEETSAGWAHAGLPAWLTSCDSSGQEAPSTHLPERAPHPTASGRQELVRSPAWRLVAATLLGLLLGGTLWGLGAAGYRGAVPGGRGDWNSAVLAAIQGQPRDSTDDAPGILLSPACFRSKPNESHAIPSTAVPLAKADLASLECCTLCHASGRGAASACQVTQLAMSCQLCHQAVFQHP